MESIGCCSLRRICSDKLREFGWSVLGDLLECLLESIGCCSLRREICSDKLREFGWSVFWNRLSVVRIVVKSVLISCGSFAGVSFGIRPDEPREFR